MKRLFQKREDKLFAYACMSCGAVIWDTKEDYIANGYRCGECKESDKPFIWEQKE